jgi:O-acetyl-ADP-ribose deacetylase (regulator of RNase III)
MTEIRLGEITIGAYQGDITELTVDAIVNAANSDLWMGSGVAGAILKKGGSKIEEEAMAQGPISPGEAVITSGGNLKARYVIHCAGMQPGRQAKTEYIVTSVENGLNLAKIKSLKTIAIPAIGAGIGGLSYHDSWKSIIKGISKLKNYKGTLESILLVAYGSTAFNKLIEVIQSQNRCSE